MLPSLSPLQERAVSAVRDWFKEVKGSVRDYEDDALGMDMRRMRDHRTNGEAPVFYLGGYAGTGKSTILPVIIDALRIPIDLICFCAPTAKAAKVMTDKLKMHGIDQRARTIHSQIYRPKRLKAEELQLQLDGLIGQRDHVLKHSDGTEEGKARLLEIEQSIKMVEHDLDKAYDISEGPKFSLNTESAIRTCSLIVVDEASMVGLIVAEDLKFFGIPILAIGDPGQLPPVQDEPGLCIGKPDFHLDEIHRQALDNPIIRLSMQAREGKMLKVGKLGSEVEVLDRVHDTATYDMTREAQVITGTNKKRWNITQRTRGMLGFRATGPCAGEPLIMCRNSRLHPELVNGAFVRCMKDTGNLEDGRVSFLLDIEDENGTAYKLNILQAIFEEHYLKVKGGFTGHKKAVFDARKFNEHADWGHVITCHKAQGSQWDDVILHDESGVFSEDAAKWLYTGITRAAKKLTVVI